MNCLIAIKQDNGLYTVVIDRPDSFRVVNSILGLLKDDNIVYIAERGDRGWDFYSTLRNVTETGVNLVRDYGYTIILE